jgi:DNA-binding NtrC family response regulator
MLRAQINSTILQVLEETQGNKAETARRLGISPATLWRKLKEIAAQEKK